MPRSSPVFREFSDAERFRISRLHALRQPGVAFIPGAIRQEFLRLLRPEVVGLDRGGVFEPMPEKVGRVRQKMYSVYMGEWGKDKEPKHVVLEDLRFSEMLAGEWVNVYNEVSQFSGFPQIGAVNSFHINKYPAVLGGLGYHKDFTNAINLIGVVAVSGDAMFYYASSRDGAGEVSKRMRPGDLALMRANWRPGTDVSPDLRPFHRVRTVGNEDRYSVVLRNKSEGSAPD